MKSFGVEPTRDILVAISRGMVKKDLRRLESWKQDVERYFSWQEIENEVLNT